MPDESEDLLSTDAPPGARHDLMNRRQADARKTLAVSLSAARAKALACDGARGQMTLNLARGSVSLIILMAGLVALGSNGGLETASPAVRLIGQLLVAGLFYSVVLYIYHAVRCDMSLKKAFEEARRDFASAVNGELQRIESELQRLKYAMIASVGDNLKSAIRARGEAAWLYAENAPFLDAVERVARTPRADTPAERAVFAKARRNAELSMTAIVYFSTGIFFAVAAMMFIGAPGDDGGAGAGSGGGGIALPAGAGIIAAFIAIFFGLPFALRLIFGGGGPLGEGLRQLQETARAAHARLSAQDLANDLQEASATLSARVDDIAGRPARGRFKDAERPTPPKLTASAAGRPPRFAFAPPPARLDPAGGPTKAHRARGR